MSRSGYSDGLDQWALIKWRGQVASAMRGKRGQAFLRDLAAALDAMPAKRLVAYDLIDATGAVCALGAVGLRRGLAVKQFDPEDHEQLAGAFDIASQLVQEIEFENDLDFHYLRETPEERWIRMRQWVAAGIRP